MLSTLRRLALVSLVAAALLSNASTTGKWAALQADASLFSAIPFDYIIVGGGTAGLAVAARLSERSDLTIGVIEGGLYHQQEPVTDTPSRFGQGIGGDLDWGFLTVPQAGANNGSILLSTGKMVGGSSGLNFMAWTRASVVEYDAWEALGNGPTWNWERIFPNATAPTAADIAAFHGATGPVKVSFNDIYGDVTVPLVKSMNALGIETNTDWSNGNATGIWNLQAAVDREAGIRSYGANSYFTLSANRPNLHVLTGAHASKIVFSSTKQGGQLVATGVQYLYGRGTFTASASKEVILSAGSLQTPKILELSGIGNKAILDKFGIPTLLDLPQVGENLQDQPIIPRDFVLHPGLLGIDSLRNNVSFALQQLKQYETTNNGLYASTVPAVAFLPVSDLITGDLNSTINALHTQLVSELGSATISPLYSAQMKIQLDWLLRKDVAHVELIMYDGGGLTVTPPTPGSSYLTILAGLMHPFSRGSVHISSAKPLDQPIVDPNYLHLSIDADVFGFMGNFTDRLAATQPLAGTISQPSTPVAGTDFLTYSRGFLETIYHPLGTAALAPQANGGVVDPTLKVYGTANVRVADASIIPLQLAAHPQSTIFAIGEKAADIILAALG